MTASSPTTPATGKPQRRVLRFAHIDDALAEAGRLVAAEREGRLDRAGSWTLGQALGHIATWASFPFDGYPPAVRPPLPVRLILRLMRGRILRNGLTPGVRLGKMPGGTLGLEVYDTDEGLRRLQFAFERLRDNDPGVPNPVFGPMTHDQWIQLNLRHAELHMGFLVPRE